MLAVWFASLYTPDPPDVVETPIVAARWTDPALLPSPVVSTRTSFVRGRPAVAAGATSLLVAWAQGVDDDATAATEIRAMRMAPLAGALDPDGGLLLAVTAGAVVGGPVVAFDGTAWLVAWVEADGAGHDLRGVAVRQDGMLVDPAPRLLVDGVALIEPAAASTGDARVLLVYARADGAATAIRAQLVPGNESHRQRARVISR